MTAGKRRGVSLKRLIDAEYHSHMLMRELRMLEVEAAPLNFRVTDMIAELRKIDSDLSFWRQAKQDDIEQDRQARRRRGR